MSFSRMSAQEILDEGNNAMRDWHEKMKAFIQRAAEQNKA